MGRTATQIALCNRQPGAGRVAQGGLFSAAGYKLGEWMVAVQGWEPLPSTQSMDSKAYSRSALRSGKSLPGRAPVSVTGAAPGEVLARSSFMDYRTFCAAAFDRLLEKIDNRIQDSMVEVALEISKEHRLPGIADKWPEDPRQLRADKYVNQCPDLNDALVGWISGFDG